MVILDHIEVKIGYPHKEMSIAKFDGDINEQSPSEAMQFLYLILGEDETHKLYNENYNHKTNEIIISSSVNQINDIKQQVSEKLKSIKQSKNQSQLELNNIKIWNKIKNLGDFLSHLKSHPQIKIACYFIDLN